MSDLILLALVAAITVAVLRAFGWRGAPVVAAAFFVLILSSVVAEGSVIREAFGFLSSFGIGEDTTRTFSRVLFVGFLGGVTADVCDEIGEERIGKGAILAARAEMLLITLPYLTSACEQILDRIE